MIVLVDRYINNNKSIVYDCIFLPIYFSKDIINSSFKRYTDSCSVGQSQLKEKKEWTLVLELEKILDNKCISS